MIDTQVSAFRSRRQRNARPAKSQFVGGALVVVQDHVAQQGSAPVPSSGTLTATWIQRTSLHTNRSLESHERSAERP